MEVIMFKIYSLLLSFLFIFGSASAMLTTAQKTLPVIAVLAAKSLNKPYKSYCNQKSLFFSKLPDPANKIVTKKIVTSLRPVINHCQTRAFHWFKNKETIAQKHERIVKRIMKYFENRSFSQKISNTEFDSIIKELEEIDSDFSVRTSEKDLLFKLVYATSFTVNPVIAPWFYNEKDIQQEMHVSIERQKRLMQVLLDKKINLNITITVADNPEYSLFIHAIQSMNVGAVAAFVENKLVDEFTIAYALSDLTNKFAQLADKANWLNSYSTAEKGTMYYDRAKAQTIKILIDILCPGLSRQYTYNGQTSYYSTKNKNNTQSTSYNKDHNVDNYKLAALDDFYQLAVGAFKPLPERVLGVSALTSKQEIKEAYKALMRKYHPDKQYDDESRKKATVVAQLINTAYSALLQRK